MLYNNKGRMRVFKKIIKALLIIVIVFAAVVGGIYAYYEYGLPDTVKNLIDYNGVTFDYTLEEENYRNKLYYQQLSEGQKVYYQCMYHAASNNETEYYTSFNLNPDAEFKARLAFGGDYPEYFWFTENVEYDVGYEKDKLGLAQHSYYLVRQNAYEFPNKDLESTVQQINDKLDEIAPTLVGEDDYNTVLNVYKYIADNTEYDMEYESMSDIRAVFLHGRGVCSSYAETFQLICNKLGFECYSVFGDTDEKKYESLEEYNTEDKEEQDAKSGPGHEWNIIRIGDKWYWVDPTWGDMVIGEDFVPIYYDMSYFLSPDAVMFIDHIASEDFEYPVCDDFSLYLNDKIGVTLETFDKTTVEDVLTEAFKDKRDNITFQFYSEEDVKGFVDWIETNKNFFKVYEYRVYPYYEGTYAYSYKSNYSVLLRWKIRSLY